MELKNLVRNPQVVVSKTMAKPAMHPKKAPSIEAAMKAVAKTVEAVVVENLEEAVTPVLQDMYDAYTLMNGDYEDLSANDPNDHETWRDDYESGLDDQFEASLEPYVDYLSADWLGKNTIDTRLWEDGGLARAAKSVSKEVYKQLTHTKTPAQVLSAVGILKSDVELFLQVSNEKPTLLDVGGLNAVVVKIRAHIGDNFDQMTVYDDVDLALDDDEILSEGAAARLGLGIEDLGVLHGAAIQYEGETAGVVMDLINKIPVKAKPKKKRAESGAKVLDGAIDPQVLDLLKHNGGTNDTAMSKSLGVSRATLNHYINGKNQFAPDVDQHEVLRGTILKHLNALHKSLALLDGNETLEVE